MSELKTHWLKNPNKNYLGHWDLPDKDLILTIKSAAWEDVEDPTKKKDDPSRLSLKRVVRFVENYKPLICNQTNAISIYKSIGIRELEDSAGARIALFIGLEVDRKNRIEVECVRVRSTPLAPPKTEADFPTEKTTLESSRNMDELKVNYMGLSKECQAIFLNLKNELKEKLS